MNDDEDEDKDEDEDNDDEEEEVEEEEEEEEEEDKEEEGADLVDDRETSSQPPLLTLLRKSTTGLATVLEINITAGERRKIQKLAQSR